MSRRTTIGSDGELSSRRANITSDQMMAEGTSSVKKQSLADKYNSNKGGYVRALQSGEAVQKEGKKIVIDPATGLEYLYTGMPKMTSAKTRSGISQIEKQFSSSQNTNQATASSEATAKPKPETKPSTVAPSTTPQTSTSVAEPAETTTPSAKNSMSKPLQETPLEKRARRLGNIELMKGETLEQAVDRLENKNVRMGRALDNAVGGLLVNSPLGQQVGSVFMMTSALGKKFSERYRRAREQEQRERSIGKKVPKN